jgi:DNA phosphorothioation-associated putative methyltransferase
MTLQRDIRAFFGSYSNACRLADDLLFRAGSAEAVDEACRRSAVGKLLPTALYVHHTALEALDPLLRVYEGCARAYLGTLDGWTLTSRLSGRTEPVESELQVVEELVVRDANDPLRIDDHVLAAPAESFVFTNI